MAGHWEPTQYGVPPGLSCLCARRRRRGTHPATTTAGHVAVAEGGPTSNKQTCLLQDPAQSINSHHSNGQHRRSIPRYELTHEVSMNINQSYVTFCGQLGYK